MNKQKSFTLIELLVVIVIIGILAGVIMISTSSSINKANIAKSKAFEESVVNNLSVNMVSRWKLDDASGTNADDAWGNNDGTVSGASWKTSNDCTSSGCLSFDALDDYVEIVDSQTMRMTQGGTITAWIYPKSIGETAGRIIDKSTDTSATNGYASSLNLPGKIIFAINGGAQLISINNAITLNQWNFLTVTFNETGRHIYVNGIDVTTTGGSETELPPNIAGAVRIGNRAGATDRTFDGYIDDVRMYDAVLSSSQIKQNYIAGLDSLLSKGNILKEEYNQRLNELAIK